MKKRIGCRPDEIMIKKECIKVGNIPKKRIVAFFNHGEKGADREMLTHPNFETAKNTAMVIGSEMKKELTQTPDMDWDTYQNILKKLEDKYKGSWFTSGGNFCHVLIDVDDNFGVVVDDQTCGLYYTKKKMDIVKRFCETDWEDTSQIVTHDYTGRNY
jgi:hypothetical protein